MLGKERLNAREDGSALNLAVLILGDQTWPNLDLIANLQNTSENGTTSDTTLQLVDLSTGLVDIEGTNDHHVRGLSKVSNGDRDFRDQALANGIDVVLQLGGDRNDRGILSDSASDELENGLVVLQGIVLPHQVDLVLQNDDVVELHNLNSSQVLRSLRLGAGFVSGNQEKGSVHDGGT